MIWVVVQGPSLRWQRELVWLAKLCPQPGHGILSSKQATCPATTRSIFGGVHCFQYVRRPRQVPQGSPIMT